MEITDEDGVLSLAYFEFPFRKAISELSKKGFVLVPARLNAIIRLEKSPYHPRVNGGNYVQESFIHIPQKGVYLSRFSPFLEKGGEKLKPIVNDSLDEDLLERFLKESIKVPYGISEFSTDDFGNNEIMRFLFDETSKVYGDYLKGFGIDKVPFQVVDKKVVDGFEKPFARQLHFAGLEYRSAIEDSSMSFDSSYGVLGAKVSLEKLARGIESGRHFSQ